MAAEISKVFEVSARAMAKDVASSIPAWAKEHGGGGRWYAETYGYTGPTSYLSAEILAEAGFNSLPQFINALLELQ